MSKLARPELDLEISVSSERGYAISRDYKNGLCREIEAQYSSNLVEDLNTLYISDEISETLNEIFSDLFAFGFRKMTNIETLNLKRKGVIVTYIDHYNKLIKFLLWEK